MAVRDLGTDCVRAFLGHLEQQRGCSPQTRNQRLAAVRSFARYVCGRLAGHWIRRYQRELGYVPVFVDGTGIEVAGRCFEQAGKGYNGERQDWLHSVFVGVLWVSARLQPGGSDVGGGWREQLEQDVEPLLRNGEQVWLRADHADYRGELVAFCAARGWDYSISLTDGRKQGPLRRILADCAYADQDWTALDAEGEEAALLLYYQPAGWARAEVYVVVRRTHEDGQPLLVPHYSFILVSRDDLPLAELVRRHRAKQGQENAFKGPLRELNLHHPPCKSYGANQADYLCGQVAQLLLRGLPIQMLPEAAQGHGLGPLIRQVVRSVARLTRSGRRLRLRFARSNRRLGWLAEDFPRGSVRAHTPPAQPERPAAGRQRIRSRIQRRRRMQNVSGSVLRRTAAVSSHWKFIFRSHSAPKSADPAITRDLTGD